MPASGNLKAPYPIIILRQLFPTMDRLKDCTANLSNTGRFRNWQLVRYRCQVAPKSSAFPPLLFFYRVFLVLLALLPLLLPDETFAINGCRLPIKHYSYPRSFPRPTVAVLLFQLISVRQEKSRRITGKLSHATVGKWQEVFRKIQTLQVIKHNKKQGPNIRGGISTLVLRACCKRFGRSSRNVINPPGENFYPSR